MTLLVVVVMLEISRLRNGAEKMVLRGYGVDGEVVLKAVMKEVVVVLIERVPVLALGVVMNMEIEVVLSGDESGGGDEGGGGAEGGVSLHTKALFCFRGGTSLGNWTIHSTTTTSTAITTTTTSPPLFRASSRA